MARGDPYKADNCTQIIFINHGQSDNLGIFAAQHHIIGLLPKINDVVSLSSGNAPNTRKEMEHPAGLVAVQIPNCCLSQLNI